MSPPLTQNAESFQTLQGLPMPNTTNALNTPIAEPKQPTDELALSEEEEDEDQHLTNVI